MHNAQVNFGFPATSILEVKLGIFSSTRVKHNGQIPLVK